MTIALSIYLQNRRAEKDFNPTNQGAKNFPAPTQGPASGSDSDLEIQVKDMLNRGQKIDAIKLYRRATGAGPKESKEAVESIEPGFHRVENVYSQADFQSQIIALLEKNHKIEAIKLYRETTGAGLKESKDAVDQIQQNL